MHAKLRSVVAALAVAIAAAAVASQAHAQRSTQCSLAGTYSFNPGAFYVRFDDGGHWHTSASLGGESDSAASRGRFFIGAHTVSFIADGARCAENTAVYSAHFGSDCATATLTLTLDGCAPRGSDPPRVAYQLARVRQ